MKKYNKIMEIFWLIIAIATAIFAGYLLKTGRTEESLAPFFLPFVAGGLYALRRWHRKKLEAHEKEQR